ncbi:MAG TPA: hypothetical protein VKA68_10695 [bacterium]|nr:hypothetical protein [bacterium]
MPPRDEATLGAPPEASRTHWRVILREEFWSRSLTPWDDKGFGMTSSLS